MLVFIGAEMLLVDVCKIPVAWSLGFTVTVLAAAMILSLRIPPSGRGGGAYTFGAKRRDDSREPA